MESIEIGEVIGGLALGLGTLAIVSLISLAVAISSIVCMWKCFTKMGAEGWASLIPFYNTWTLCKHTWGKGAMMFTWIIPLAGPFFMLATYWKMFKGFGKGRLFCVFGLLFSPIAMAICAFDSSTYTKGE